MGLVGWVPRLDRPRQARLDPVNGQPPDLTRLDQGCAFRPRCCFAVDSCAQVRPPLEPAVPAGHLAACLRGEEIVAAAGAVAWRLLQLTLPRSSRGSGCRCASRSPLISYRAAWT